MIVENALRLFSQDRTGRVDYALESGGEKQMVPQNSAQYFKMAAHCSYFFYFFFLNQTGSLSQWIDFLFI